MAIALTEPVRATAPTGKGLYTRNALLYPGDNPGAYAAELGCSFVVLRDKKTSDAQVLQAKRAGLRVFLYEMPDAWTPSTWAATLTRQTRRAQRLGLEGIVADVEKAPVWKDRPADVAALGRGLAAAAAVLPSVGFTSFPFWPYVREVAASTRAAGVWGSPQLYSVKEPAPIERLQARSEVWRRSFGGGVTPSLAAWSRDAGAQADYLRGFTYERGAILWTSTEFPAPGSALFRALRDWQPIGAENGGLVAAVKRRRPAGGILPLFLLGSLGAGALVLIRKRAA